MHARQLGCALVVCAQMRTRSEIWYRARISLSYYSQILLPLCAWVPCKWARVGRGEGGAGVGERGGWERKREPPLEVGGECVRGKWEKKRERWGWRKWGRKKRGGAGWEEGRSRGGYQSHQDESAFVRLFIISLYHSLDHHNTAAMLEEFSNAPPTHRQTHTHTHTFLPPCLPPSPCPSILSSLPN